MAIKLAELSYPFRIQASRRRWFCHLLRLIDVWWWLGTCGEPAPDRVSSEAYSLCDMMHLFHNGIEKKNYYVTMKDGSETWESKS